MADGHKGTLDKTCKIKKKNSKSGHSVDVMCAPKSKLTTVEMWDIKTSYSQLYFPGFSSIEEESIPTW